MKVTVCFGGVRVVVPCGDGDIPVKDLIRQAIVRYKKATGKPSDAWVSVRALRSQSGGGILDPDDLLSDVADDRETIVAAFREEGGGGSVGTVVVGAGDGAEADGEEEREGSGERGGVERPPHAHHGGGDGASGSSSVGTGSPDMFTDGDHKYAPPPPTRPRPLSAPRPRPQGPATDIEVTGSDLANTPQLQVRRGSEPTLNQLLLDEGVAPGEGGDVGPSQPAALAHHLHPQSKRWSAAAPVGLGDGRRGPEDLPETLNLPEQGKNSSGRGLSGNVYLNDDWESRRNPLQEGGEGEEESHEIMGHGSRSKGVVGSAQRAGVGGSQRSSAFTRFVRDSNRLSVQFLGDSPGGWKWAEAAERAANTSLSSPSIGVGRREPLGAPHHPSPTPSPKLPIVSGVPVSDPEDDLTSSDDQKLLGDKFELPKIYNALADAASSCRKHVTPLAVVEYERLEFVAMRNESGPLGIHVVPDYDRLGKDRGLLVQGIEPGGRIDRDGRLAIYDRIIEINGENLLDMPFHRVQEIFKNSLKAPELQLRVVKHKSTVGTLKKPPPPVFPKSISREQINLPASQPSTPIHSHTESQQNHQPQKPPIRPKPRGESSAREEKENCIGMVEAEERLSADTKMATVSPTKRVPQAVPGARNTNSLLHANTRKIGKKFEIELLKGPNGLGFSITTRDNPAGGNCPIYIKNILPKGAAVEDGRLKPGDRLLEVNGVEMTGKSQSDAVAVLRNAPQGSRVMLVVSRQQVERTSPTGAAASPASNELENGGENGTSKDELKNISNRSSSPQLPRKLGSPEPAGTSQDERKTHNNEPPEKVNDDSLLFPWKQREIITFEIPVHDTEKAGLGVSVKGKTTCSDSGRPLDLGIFVKSVIHGGAASRDGRLRTNDQLVDVNGVSLLGCSNSDAMETLRRVMMMSDGPKPGVITLTVARRVPTAGESGRDSVSSLLTNSSGTETFGAKSESESHTPDHSGASENSENTVIFLPCNNGKTLTNGGRDFIDSPLEDNLNMKSTYSAKVEDKNLGDLDPMNARNPVIDRLTGQNALRNESYYRATNDTWNATMLMSGQVGEKGPGSSPTVNCPSGEMVLIEEEYIPSHHHHHHPSHQPQQQHDSHHRHHQKNQIQHPQNNQHHQGPNEKERQDIPTKRLGEYQHASGQNGSDITYESQTSLEEAEAAGFSRDAFGRQSMSEKRHATLDAKNTDTYQRNKRLREERERQRQMQMQQQQMNDMKRAEQESQKDHQEGLHGYPRRDHYISREQAVGMVRANSAESIISLTRSQAESDGNELRKHELGPSLGMKKSSSLESLQTMVQEIQMQEDPENPYSYHHHGVGTISGGGSGSSRVVVRGRGCNESFRAAVDRSYEAPLGLAEFRSRMETLAEEDNDGGPMGMNRVGSDRGGLVGHRGDGGGIPTGPYLTRGGSRQSSLGAEGISKKGIGGKHSKKGSTSSSAGSGGLLKGIGSMFRFGKHRKTVEVPSHLGRDKEEQEVEGGNSVNVGKIEVERGENVENAVDVPNTQGMRQNGVPGGPLREGSSGTVERPPDNREREREQARLDAQEEQQRIQEQYRRLMQRQRQLEQQQQNNEMDGGHGEASEQHQQGPYHQMQHQQGPPPPHGHHVQGPGGEREQGMEGSSRAERIQQLRAQHQRRHAERRGQYPMDDREERYEEAIRQSLDHHADAVNHDRLRSRLPQPQVMHTNEGGSSYDGGHYGRGGSSVIRVMDGSSRVRGSEAISDGREEGGSRPGSRLGTPLDPAQFSHYVNYEEIQQHLSKRKEQLTEQQILQMRLQVQHQRLKVEEESRRQQHYHSQRRDNRDSPFHHARPVSNFYEYESVLQGTSTGGSLGPPHPHHHNHGHPHHQLPMRRQVVADESVRQIGVAWQQPLHGQRGMVEGGSGSLPKRLGGVAGSVGRIAGGNYLHPRIYQPASASSVATKPQGYSVGVTHRSGSSNMQQQHQQQPPQKQQLENNNRHGQYQSSSTTHIHHARSGSSGFVGNGPPQQSSGHWRGPYVTTTRIRPVEACGPPQPGSKV